jgi:hypothetical protein
VVRHRLLGAAARAYQIVHVVLLIVLFFALAVFCYFVIGAKFRWARRERAALDSGEKRPLIRLGHRRQSPDQDR